MYTDLRTLPPYNTSFALQLKSLYSDISRQKHSNPASYRSTVHWWHEVSQIVALQQTGIVESSDIVEGDVQGSKRIKGDYVLCDLVEPAARGVLAHQQAKETGAFADKLYTVESFKRGFSGVALLDVVLSDLDIEILLKYRECDMKVVADGKFVDEDTESLAINVVDSGLLELKTAIQNLNTEIEPTQNRIKEQTQRASSRLKKNRKEIALGHLRARKQLEDILVKCSKGLENLSPTLRTVEHAVGDVEVLGYCSQIMKLYQSSTVTLRTILSHPPLQRDKIDETTEALHKATEMRRVLT
ncbi:hypothetical protein BDM02DRAFT_3127227 [Thelephora ganbajun]|uniref:Uncharacterized protein n=1 Tax=Thelephora ganbajun TaxID=370292 RepID=A0ACB6ZPN2_THEGA|nr:hypothetical protein BDM02DRAFT_3127227 [Thelephora ganbajun]